MCDSAPEFKSLNINTLVSVCDVLVCTNFVVINQLERIVPIIIITLNTIVLQRVGSTQFLKEITMTCHLRYTTLTSSTGLPTTRIYSTVRAETS